MSILSKRADEKLPAIRRNPRLSVAAPMTQKNRLSLPAPNAWLNNLIRLGFLLLVLGVLGGAWLVSRAHLAEQFLGTQQQSQRLIDRNAGQGALTPEYIEQQILAFSLRLQDRDLYVAAGSNPQQRPFVINPGEPARFVAARLEQEGFITNAELFNLYLRVSKFERRINAGNFMLAETMTMPEIAQALQNALFEEVNITIPEGFRLEEIADRLVQNNVVTQPDEFLDAVRTPRRLSIFADYDFLQSLPADASLEGFLFPDTYRLPVFASSMELVIQPFLDNFARKVGTEALNNTTSGLRGRDLIILASIVEREAVQSDERPLIASVYINRLNNSCPDVGGRYLQADPTVQYAKGAPGNWWWKPTDIREYAAVASTYNTYLNPGLPPGPIANPGFDAIQASRNPAATAYCFFVGTNENGRHVFAATLADHEQNMRAYGYLP
jgi:UPF0755 protein